MISFNRLPTILVLSFFILFFSNLLNGQETDLLMVNSKKIDQKRYEDVKGNPYLYKKWKKGSIISADADVIENVLLNYNGESNSFEIKKDNRFIELDPRWYVRVLVEEEPDEAAVIFQKNFLPPLEGKFTRLVYNGKKIKVVEEFTSKISTKVFNNVGKNLEVKDFYNKKQYFLIRDKKAVPLRLKKKNLLSALGEKALLESFIKKEKLKLDSEAQLIQLLDFFEQIIQ